MTSFRVRDTSTGQIVPGIPTPLLIEAAGANEAYYEPPSDPNGPWKGVWFLHVEPRHVSPDGKYVKVRVEHTDDWAVDLNVTVIDHSYHEDDPDAPEPYNDRFIVEAATRQEAEELAMEKAREDVEERYDSFDATDIRIIRATKGESI